MKTWEAMKALEEGKKVRQVDWEPDEYIVINFKYSTDSKIVDEKGNPSYIQLVDYEWEIYDDRKDAPLAWRMLYKKLIEAAEFIEGEISTGYVCNKGECHDCPFTMLCDLYSDLFEELERLNKYFKLDKKHEFED